MEHDDMEYNGMGYNCMGYDDMECNGMPDVVAGIPGELEITADEVKVIVQSLEVRRSGM